MNDVITVNYEIENKGLQVEYFQDFINYLDASPKTIASYKRSLKQFFKYLLEEGITKPKREDILNFRNSLSERLKPATVQSYIVAVRLFFRHLEQQGLYKNVAEHIKGAKISREHKKDYLTPAQVKRVLSKVDRSTETGLRDYAILTLMVTGALRTIEITRANIEDLRTAGDKTVLYIQGKGREERTEYIKLIDTVEGAIRDYLAVRENVSPLDPLFTSTSNKNKGGRLTTRSISRLVKQSFLDAGYNSDRLTAHSLRHTAVTLALLGGEDLDKVQQFARHKNINTTQIYAHHLDRAKNTCESTIANSIF